LYEKKKNKKSPKKILKKKIFWDILKVVTNEKGEAVGEFITIIC
jgi:hypothetical protein